MSGKTTDNYTSVVATTFYTDNVLTARDAQIELPEAAYLTADVNVGGTISVPLRHLIDNMEMTITKVGADSKIGRMLSPKMHNYEARFVQEVVDVNGNAREVGAKAFIKGIPNKIPAVSINPSEASELEATITVFRYELFIDGVQQFCIDKTAGIIKVNGTDYGKNLNSML